VANPQDLERLPIAGADLSAALMKQISSKISLEPGARKLGDEVGEVWL
jgi:hypothetical protein